MSERSLTEEERRYLDRERVARSRTGELRYGVGNAVLSGLRSLVSNILKQRGVVGSKGFSKTRVAPRVRRIFVDGTVRDVQDTYDDDSIDFTILVDTAIELMVNKDMFGENPVANLGATLAEWEKARSSYNIETQKLLDQEVIIRAMTDQSGLYREIKLYALRYANYTLTVTDWTNLLLQLCNGERESWLKVAYLFQALPIQVLGHIVVDLYFTLNDGETEEKLLSRRKFLTEVARVDALEFVAGLIDWTAREFLRVDDSGRSDVLGIVRELIDWIRDDVLGDPRKLKDLMLTGYIRVTDPSRVQAVAQAMRSLVLYISDFKRMYLTTRGSGVATITGIFENAMLRWIELIYLYTVDYGTPRALDPIVEYFTKDRAISWPGFYRI